MCNILDRCGEMLFHKSSCAHSADNFVRVILLPASTKKLSTCVQKLSFDENQEPRITVASFKKWEKCLNFSGFAFIYHSSYHHYRSYPSIIFVYFFQPEKSTFFRGSMGVFTCLLTNDSHNLNVTALFSYFFSFSFLYVQGN